eukprot:jgi/Tetstr1/444378/TSEL_032268.t1
MAASSTAQPPGVVKTLTDDKKRKRPVKKRRGMRNEYLRSLAAEYAPDESGPAVVRAISEVASLREAERRVAERAGNMKVDNMKEAYVSVLAPYQLGVGISARDSVLIHGVHLIAEKLGPRHVHADLHNANNQTWRGTTIQRHIE